MSTPDYSKTFEQMAVDAGLPTTEAQAKAMWQAEADAVDSPYNNSSEHSPFWRTIVALVTAPVLWIVKDLLLKSVLPNMFLRTASGSFLDLFGWAVDLEKKAAAKAIGRLTFRRLTAVGEIVIPAGTIIRSPVINGRTYHLITTEAGTMADGISEVNVRATAAEVGAGYNLPAGYYGIFSANISGVDSVANEADWLLSAGADEESYDDYRMRIRNQFSAVNQYHIDSVYRKIITSFANINTRNVYFEHNAPRGAGTANAYILMDVGQPSADLLAAIETHLMDEGNHGHGDDVRIFSMPETLHDLTVTVSAAENATAEETAELLAGVEGAVRAAFRENNQYTTVTVSEPWSDFSFSRLGGELHNLFPLLSAVNFSLSTIESELNIPRLNSLLVVSND